MFTRILVATDLSEGSSEAIRQAYAYVHPAGGALAVCHVHASMLGVHARLPQQNAPAFAQGAELEARVRGLVEEQVAACAPAAGVEVFVEEGGGYASIVRRSEAWSADLVVVGNCGMSAAPRMDLGSVATQVVRNAHCAVLVARATATRGVVVAATDFSDASLPAVAAGIQTS
jgi:nucleotide-binding universal stress UspA family protein